MQTVAILQARMGSTRLPNKVMAPICGTPLIALLLARLSQAKLIDRIVLATTQEEKDDSLCHYVESLGYEVFRGSERDVLDRYYQAAKSTKAHVVVRITGDCPLIDAHLVDEVVALRETAGADFSSNQGFPDGLDVGVCTFSALEEAWQRATSAYDREHVTPYISNSSRFLSAAVKCKDGLSEMRWTVDEPEDLLVARNIFEHFHPRNNFSWTEILELERMNPNLFASNRHLVRNEGATMGTGQKLWRRAKRVIPGGSMLLSKRAEMFLPNHWPAYFSRAKGCRVWDLDGNEFIDMSIMGIGTNTLGYGCPEVDEAVIRAVSNGNMSTLNAPEEVHLAERLIELHDWSDMVRFARSGGEANAIAIRIARAASDRDKVAFCGYHGWHDWYLAANLGSENVLAGHLLPGLEPNGVPEHLKGSALTFMYNDIQGLENLISDNPDIGVIKMEVSRNRGPNPGYLEKVREIATRNNIVLIFDECTSGFRETFGGLHKKYGVNPDIAMFGKALGNGYAVTAIIGRREVMEAAQTTFISSTFWTERIGSVAGLATLEAMEKTESWSKISQIGQGIKLRWADLAVKSDLKIDIWGLDALAGFTVQSKDSLKYKTFITQEMLKQGFLVSNTVYACTAHTAEVIDSYFEALEKVFLKIRDCESGQSIDDLLEGPVCHAGFRRLN